MPNLNPCVERIFGFVEYKLRQPLQTFVWCPFFLMSDFRVDKFEREIVAVGRELASVSQKKQSQSKSMKGFIHKYKVSLVVERMDFLGIPSSLGSPRIDPLKLLSPLSQF